MNANTTTMSDTSMDTIQSAPSEMACCDTQETTTFTDEGVTVAVIKSSRPEPAAFTFPDSDIANFLAKPYLVTQGTWHVSDTFSGGALYTGSIGTLLTGNSLWTNKLQGYNLMRAKAIIRLVINATPFQAGKLLLSVMPLQSNFVGYDAGFAKRHTLTLQGLRMLPCVEIDCRDSVATLDIPYIAPNNFYNLKTGLYDWGQIYLNVLSVLATGGTETTVDYSLYLRFEGLELAGPMVPQMAKFKGKTGNLGEKEEAAYNNNSISGVLKTVSSAATILEGIPILSSVMGPAAWISGWLGNTAASFGWSKPISEEAPGIMSKHFNRYTACSDGLDMSIPLAISASNKTNVTDRLSLYDGDEMSFDFLKSVSTFYTNFSWPATTTSGNSLFSQAISPQKFFGTGTFTSGAHVVTFHQGPPIYYLSNMFTMWRGSVEVTIKFAKTEYHSGRLQITWTPYNNSSYNVPTLNTSMVALREIVDIRTQSEITLNLPYMIETNYLSNNWSSPGISGYLDILVLNELRNPDTAAATIDCLVYVRGGPDFEFAAPVIPNALPYQPQMNSSSLAQALSKPIGSSRVGPNNCDQAAESVGERWGSIKQLLSRYSCSTYPTALPNNTFAGIAPYAGGLLSVTTAGAITGADLNHGTFNYMWPMYLYHRGSINVGFLRNPATLSSATNSEFMAYINPDFPGNAKNVFTSGKTAYANFGTVAALMTSPSTAGLGMVVSDQNQGFASFKVPYYCPTKASVLMHTSVASPQSNDISVPLSRLEIYSSANLLNAGIYRSYGDDYQMSYFLGCPPIYVSNT